MARATEFIGDATRPVAVEVGHRDMSRPLVRESSRQRAADA
jgi:hypothetical protein